MAETLLTINPGSATIKLGLFERDVAGLRPIGRATLDEASGVLSIQAGATRIEHGPSVPDSPHEAIKWALARLTDHLSLGQLKAIGQRVVHGGDAFTGPVVITDAVLAEIEALAPLAPLHQPKSVNMIRALRNLHPEVTQIACFDTAFHTTLSDLVRRFAIPRILFDQGVKRYGFHGLSYYSVVRALERYEPELAGGRVIAAHLGAGSSLCALQGGLSRDTTMGFSTLDGVPMASRCGAIDPGVLFHLMRAGGQSADALEEMLYHRSGLLGLSGISGDTRVLARSDAPSAREALEIFAFRVAREVAALAATIGGIDAFVFTGGIGEHQPDMRARICARLSWLGVALDAEANRAGRFRIEAAGSKVAVLVVTADEEHTIAAQCGVVLDREAAADI